MAKIKKYKSLTKKKKKENQSKILFSKFNFIKLIFIILKI